MRPTYRLVREWRQEDLPQLYALAKKQGQFFTNPTDQRNGITLVAEDENGAIIATLTGRITAELMLTVDPEAAAPVKMFAAIKTLWDDLMVNLYRRGIMDVHAPVDPKRGRFALAALDQGFKKDNRIHLLFDVKKEMEK